MPMKSLFLGYSNDNCLVQSLIYARSVYHIQVYYALKEISNSYFLCRLGSKLSKTLLLTEKISFQGSNLRNLDVFPLLMPSCKRCLPINPIWKGKMELMPPSNKRRTILKCSNAALIRQFTRKKRRLSEGRLRKSYFTSSVYSSKLHDLRNILF